MSNFRGSTFIRTFLAVMNAGDTRTALMIAEKRWGAHSPTALVLKAAVAAGNTFDPLWAGNLAEADGAQMEFLEVVRPMTIVGRLAHLRRVPVRVPVAANSAGTVAYWVGEGKAKPVTSAAFDRKRLSATKVVGLAVISEEMGRFGDSAELTLRDDIATAISLATDAAFIDPANTGVIDERPAAVTADAITIPSSGGSAENIRADIEAAIAAFGGNLTTAAWVTHPRAAVSIGLRLSAAGLANDLGALGGTLAGLPVLTSEAVPYDSTGTLLVLVDAGSVLYAEEGIRLDRSNQASVAMSDSPDDGPVTAVSLFQTNSIGLLVERVINWEVGRANGVVVITGVSYTG